MEDKTVTVELTRKELSIIGRSIAVNLDRIEKLKDKSEIDIEKYELNNKLFDKIADGISSIEAMLKK